MSTSAFNGEPFEHKLEGQHIDGPGRSDRRTIAGQPFSEDYRRRHPVVAYYSPFVPRYVLVFRFSLDTLLVAIAICAIVLGYLRHWELN